MQQSNKGFFRAAFLFAAPIALQNLVSNLLVIVDTALVGRVGEGAIAAVGVVGQINALLFTCFFGFCSSGTLFFSQYWGVRDMRGIRRAFGLSAWIILAIGGLFTVAGLLAPGWMVSILTNDAAIQAIAVQYLRIVCFSFLTQGTIMVLSGLLRSCENVKIPLFTACAAMVLDTFLSWMLIYGHLGFTALGVRGAAIATVVSSFCNAGLLVFFALRRVPAVRQALLGLLRVEWGFFGEYIKKSVPIILNEVLFGLAVTVIYITFGRQGPAALEAVSIVRTMEMLLFGFFGGLATAGAVMVGKSVGAWRLDEALWQAKRFTAMTAVLSFCVIAILNLLRGPMSLIFGIGPEVQGHFYAMLIVAMFTLALRTVNYMQVNLYRAGGEAKWGMFLEVGGIWLFSVPLVALAGFVWDWPFWMVYLCYFADEPVKFCIELPLLLRGKWRKPVTVRPEGCD